MKLSSTLVHLCVCLCFIPSIAHICDSDHLNHEVSRSLKLLKKPLVILLSTDGFRWGYQWKVPTPNIHRLINNGTQAFPGMVPVYPSVTFVNHYSIATGLYPAWHGIISHSFRDPSDSTRKTFFRKGDFNPKWWIGEPIWETLASHGLQAAVYFWPGSEVVRPNWKCPSVYCHTYNKSIPFNERVDAALNYVDLPDSRRPSLIAVYLDSPDEEAHVHGPDSPQVSDAVTTVDKAIGRLVDGLERRGVFEDVHLILVSDHGFVGTCESKLIFLEDLAQWIKIPEDWIETVSPVLGIRPPPGVDFRSVVRRMNQGLASTKVVNGNYLKVYLRDDLSPRLKYSGSERIQPIIGMVSEGYKLKLNRASGNTSDCGGAHGYDNEYGSMKAIFIGHGPRFPRGKQVPSFVNVEVYNVIAEILGIKGAANNGTETFARSVLLPSKRL